MPCTPIPTSGEHSATGSTITDPICRFSPTRHSHYPTSQSARGASLLAGPAAASVKAGRATESRASRPTLPRHRLRDGRRHVALDPLNDTRPDTDHGGRLQDAVPCALRGPYSGLPLRGHHGGGRAASPAPSRAVGPRGRLLTPDERIATMASSHFPYRRR